MSSITQLVLCISLLGLSQPTQAAPISLKFESFLKSYLSNSSDTQQAMRRLSNAGRTKTQRKDQWRSRLEAAPELSFDSQVWEANVRPDVNIRTSNVSGTFTQSMPYGTSLQLNGQKFIEPQNPLFSATDRRYSARLTQDLGKNAFGKSQRNQAKLGDSDFEVAQLQFQQSVVNACETAFSLYSDAYVQQEIAEILKAQLADAKKALKISRQLYRDKLIDQVDQITSENDFIDTQLQVEQAEQTLFNTKLQIQAFLNKGQDFKLSDPSRFISTLPAKPSGKTLNEEIIAKQLKSQDYVVETARSDRWTDVQLGLEAGESFGRLTFNGPTVSFQEQFLRANVTFGFDLVNNTENAELKNAVYQKNSLVKEEITLQKAQKNRVNALTAMNDLLKQQVVSSEKQVKLLERKMKIAFGQMKRAKLDFQNYLLHRNAYLNQQRNFLNLKQDLWLNQFAIQKEFAHQAPGVCEVSS